MIHSSRIRFQVDPRDVPLEKAARRLHLTTSDFQTKLQSLLARGFPQPDPTTGMFDLAAIDQWMTSRHDQKPGRCALTAEPKPRNAQEVLGDRRAWLGRDKIRYLPFKKGRWRWRPTKTMREAGFVPVRLDPGLVIDGQRFPAPDDIARARSSIRNGIAIVRGCLRSRRLVAT
jgi:hypothetical protein